MPQTGHSQSATPQAKHYKHQKQYDQKPSNTLLPFQPLSHPVHSNSTHLSPFHKHPNISHSQANLPLHHQPPVYLSSSSVLPMHNTLEDDQANRQLLVLLDQEQNQSQQTNSLGPKPLHTGSMKYRLGLILDDLCCRFIANCPSEETQSFERLFFQIEYAHWFYEDFYREVEKLPSFHLKEFARIMFNHCSLLIPYANSLNELWDNFKNYKFQVPAYGAILLNPTLDKCLLVKGWRPRSSWGFPKGKINKNEPESDCAIREVIEETGFDISSRLVETDYIEGIVNEQKIKLYVIMNIDESTPFAPRTRKEISKIEWHVINDLPVSNQHSKEMLSSSSTANYYMVYPFVGKLKSWLKKKQLTEISKKQVKGRRSGTQTEGRVTNFIAPSSTPFGPSSSTSLTQPTHQRQSIPSPALSPQPSSGETSPELLSQANKGIENETKMADTVKEERIDGGKQKQLIRSLVNGVHLNNNHPVPNGGLHIMKIFDTINSESRGEDDGKSFFRSIPLYSQQSISSSSSSSLSVLNQLKQSEDTRKQCSTLTTNLQGPSCSLSSNSYSTSENPLLQFQFDIADIMSGWNPNPTASSTVTSTHS